MFFFFCHLKYVYLELVRHVLKSVQHLIRWWEGCGQSDLSDDAIQAIHITYQQTRALIITGWRKKQKHNNVRGLFCFSAFILAKKYWEVRMYTSVIVGSACMFLSKWLWLWKDKLADAWNPSQKGKTRHYEHTPRQNTLTQTHFSVWFSKIKK